MRPPCERLSSLPHPPPPAQAPTRTPRLPERLHQERDLPLDPGFVALLPHPEVTEDGQGKPPGVLPGWAIVENNP